MSSQFKLLTQRKFLPFFVTQFLGAFNDNVIKNALLTMATFKAMTWMGFEDGRLTALAAGIFILPFFIFSATAGKIADQLPKASLIRKIKFCEILLMAFATYGFLSESLSILLGALCLMGVQSAFFGPVKYAILPEYIDKNSLLGANGLVEMGTFLAILSGTILGALAITYENGPILISALLLIFSLLGYLSSCFIPKMTLTDTPSLKLTNPLTDTLSVLKQATQKKSIWMSILGISWFWFYGATLLTQFPSLAKNVLHGDEHLTTFFLATFSIAIALGSLSCHHLLKEKVTPLWVPLTSLLMSFAGLDLYFVLSYIEESGLTFTHWTSIFTNFSGIRLSLDLFFIAYFGGIYIVPLYAYLQTESSPKERSQIISANNILNALFMVVSALFSMVVLSVTNSLPILILATVGLSFLITLYICQILPTELTKSLMRIVLKFFFKVEIKGLENIEHISEKSVIIANHTSFLDGLLLGAYLPYNMTFAINTQIAQKWWVKPALFLFDLLTVDPTKPMAIKTLVNKVKQGHHIVIFPEGRLTRTGSLMKIYEGPGTVSYRADAPIIPVRIEGAQYSKFSRLSKIHRLRWFPKITLTVQQPVQYEVSEDLTLRERRKYLSQKLYETMSHNLFTTNNKNQTLFSSLLDARYIHGAHHDLIEDIARTPLSYGQIIKGSFALGHRLAAEIDEDKVGFLLPNSNGAAVTFFALQAYGITPAMLNFSAGISSIKSACQTTQLKTIITSKLFIEKSKLQDLIDALSDYKIIYLEDIKAQLSSLDKLFGLFGSIAPYFLHKKVALTERIKEQAVILFTSGSEGSPKGVSLASSNLTANKWQMASVIDFNAQDTVFNVLPIFHSFGLTGGMLLPMLSGVKTFFYPSPLHYRIVPELIYDTNATILFGTDTFLNGYARFADSYDFYSIRYIFAGAEKLKAETRTLYAEKYGIRIFEGYGATETAPVLCCNTPMHCKPGTVGRFMPGIQYKLESVPGIETGGRLFVKGPNIMQGYYKEEAPGTLQPLTDGWYDTGDIVAVDELGYVSIQGRAKRFAKIAGEMVSLTALESLLTQISPEYGHVVIAVEDSAKGEKLILLSTDPNLDKATIQKQLKAKDMPDLMLPREIIHQEEIPLLGTGKTDYVSATKLVQELLSS